MIITRKQFQLIERLAQLAKYLKPTAQLIEMRLSEEDSSGAVEAAALVSFGPTHRLMFKFKGSKIEEAGSTWTFTYDDDGILAEVSNENFQDEQSWIQFRQKLGLT